jgi:hypothetical protein
MEVSRADETRFTNREQEVLAQAVEMIKRINRDGPRYTMFEMLGAAYGRGPQRGKTIHVVEHTAGLGDRRVAPRGTWLKVSRMKGAAPVVISRILYPVAADDSRRESWRTVGSAVVQDGSEHPAIRKRLDGLVAKLKTGWSFPGPPLGVGTFSRAGARDVEAVQRFDLTYKWMEFPREMRAPKEETIAWRSTIIVPCIDELGRPVVGLRAQAVHKETRRTQKTTTDKQGRAIFRDLAPGIYSVRVFASDGRCLVTGDTRPRDYEFNRPWIPDRDSTAIARYRLMHASSRKRGRQPAITEATAWLTVFEPGYLEPKWRRNAAIKVLRATVSTGMNRTRPAYTTPRSLALALTGAYLGRTPDAVRKAVAASNRPR